MGQDVVMFQMSLYTELDRHIHTRPLLWLSIINDIPTCPQMCDADPDYKVLVPAKDYANQQQSGPFMEEGNLYQEIADVPPDQATESSLSKLEPAQIEKLVEMYYTLMEKVGHKAQPKETETTEQGFAGDTQPSPEPHPYQNLYEEVENEQDSGKIYRAAKPAEVKIPVPKPRKKGLQKGLLSKARMNGQPTTNGESLKKLGMSLIIRGY